MKKFILLIFLEMGILSADPQLLSVSGSGKVFIKATVAEIRLGIEVEGKNSLNVQNELSQAINQLTLDLKKHSFIRLETSAFSVYPEYSDGSPRHIKGYRGEGELLITTLSENAGEMIALAMEAGATKVNGIDLKASDDEIEIASRAAIKKACEQAMHSAEAALEALHLSFEEIVEIDLNPQEPIFHPFRAAAAFNTMEKRSTGPQVEGEQMVQSHVNLKMHFRAK